MLVTLVGACVFSCLSVGVQDGFRIIGVVRDVQGGALPGVEITLTDGRSVVADAAGRFEVVNLTRGAYELRAALAGFRAQTQQVRVGESPTTSVEFVLALGMLVEALPVEPEPEEAYREAVAIAHVRIVRELPPLPCSELRVVSALHEAVVLAELKGSLPPTIHFLQDSSGTCVEGSTSARGIGDRPYRPGNEYVLFLVRDGERFNRLAGGSLAFPVRNGRVGTHGFDGLPDVVDLATFRAALQRLAQ
jgi:hypothetical protein